MSFGSFWVPLILIIMNILVWVFLFGKTIGKVNTRLNNVEKMQNSPGILPECSEIFTEIKQKLSKLDGKVEAMLIGIKDFQKNNERKHIRKRK